MILTHKEPTYTQLLSDLAISGTITEPEIAAGELHRAYKNANRLKPKRFQWKRHFDEYNNPVVVLTRVA